MHSACDYAAAHVQQSCGTRAHGLHVSCGVTLLLAVLAKRLNTTPVLWDEMQHAPYFNYRAADDTIHQVRVGGWVGGRGAVGRGRAQAVPVSLHPQAQHARGRLLDGSCTAGANGAFRWQEQGVQVCANLAGKLSCR